MKCPLYYLICAIACTSMVSATLPMSAIAEAVQPRATAEQQAQADVTNSYKGKAEDGTNTNVTADTVEDGTATSTGTSAVNTESADGTTAATGTPAPSLRAQTNPTPAAISATSQTGYAHSATASQNGVTFTVSWNDTPRAPRRPSTSPKPTARPRPRRAWTCPPIGTAAARKASATRRALHGPATTAWAPRATTLPLTSRHRARTASTSTLWTTTETTPKTTRGSTTCAPRRR